MCFFSAGPWKTMSRSSGVSSQNGTSVRTPIAPHTCFMRSHMSVPHGSTAPSSMVMDSSGHERRLVYRAHDARAAAGGAGARRC